MPVPDPTPIYRFIHIENLSIYLQRGGLHAPNHSPANGLIYKTIHNVEIQDERRKTKIPCGPGGVIHDYVGFYFGYLSPMLLQLKTGRVEGYKKGQEPLIYLVSTAQAVAVSGPRFAFSDGHGIAAFTRWYDDLSNLDKVDWSMVYEHYWKDKLDDMDRQRRKQAEFLAYQCPGCRAPVQHPSEGVVFSAISAGSFSFFSRQRSRQSSEEGDRIQSSAGQ